MERNVVSETSVTNFSDCLRNLMAADSQMLEYVNTGNIVEDTKAIVEAAQVTVRSTVNVVLVRRNWLIGKRIAEEELRGEKRAEYGARLIKTLSRELKAEYGKGFGAQELYKYRRFFDLFPEIFDSASRKSFELLTWTHYRSLLTI